MMPRLSKSSTQIQLVCLALATILDVGLLTFISTVPRNNQKVTPTGMDILFLLPSTGRTKVAATGTVDVNICDDFLRHQCIGNFSSRIVNISTSNHRKYDNPLPRCLSTSGLIVGDLEHLADSPSSKEEEVITLAGYGCKNN